MIQTYPNIIKTSSQNDPNIIQNGNSTLFGFVWVLIVLLFLFPLLFGCTEKVSEMTPKRVCPESLGRVPVSTGAQFSFLQPNRNRAPKRVPKWSFWGAKVLTILLFRRPVDSFWGPPFEVLFGPCPETRAVPMEKLGLQLRLPEPLLPLI